MKVEMNRREALQTIGRGGLGLAITPAAIVAQTKGKEEKKGEDVAPAEDLMREHGLLNRVLLIYEDIGQKLSMPKPDVKVEALQDSAAIIRHFIEEYHEKLEEDYLFTRFQKAGKLVDLVKVLKEQHEAGRRVTAQILHLATDSSLKDASNRQQLIVALNQFVRMYRPHESREDTVLFPAIHDIVSAHEYASLGEEFEKKEHQLFGEEGFEKMVVKVAGVEKSLGIYDLAQFTPKR